MINFILCVFFHFKKKERERKEGRKKGREIQSETHTQINLLPSSLELLWPRPTV